MPNELPPRDEYLPRIVDDQVRRYLEIFGAVERNGAGKPGRPVATAKASATSTTPWP